MQVGSQYDICHGEMKPSNPIPKAEPEQDEEPKALLPRKGLVLLKRFFTLPEQYWIVTETRRLGLGQGGFYWPKRHHMRMCLGLDWDSETRRYHQIRPFDKAPVPKIPHEFLGMAKRAMHYAQSITQREYGSPNVDSVLPMISPDVCLINFYTPLGNLGLHQDRSESGASLNKGVPIVSFSVGDSAKFLYSKDPRRTPETVVLESGDVLIFVGPSRHIFHGVQSVIPRTARVSLVNETGLLPGRLNLTFRQF